MQKHKAIYISNNDDKKALILNLINGDIFTELKSLKGALFSEITINKLIEEEKRHGRYEVATRNKHSLTKSSQGERKKALIKHLLQNKPDYLIADNVYGSLDVASQKEIEQTLENLGQNTLLIQILNRKSEILSFIEEVYVIKNNTPVLVNRDALESKTTNYFLKDIPKPLLQIHNNYEALIRFNNVSVSYFERPIIKNISWEVKPGEFWQLKGPNGSGKSTILSLITGDNPKAFQQDIHLFGVKKGSGESIWDIKEKIGYFTSEMLQGFKRSDSIERMIISGFFDSVGLYKLPSKNKILKAHEWLKLLNMYEIKNQNFQTLSNGRKRLVLIARAMVKHPPLLILDEPTNGLDDADIKMFTELINKIAKESNTAILYVSHRIEEGLSPKYIYELTPRETGSTGAKII